MLSARLIVIAFVASCMPESEIEIDVAQKKFGNCPDWGCGTNSPVIDGLGFHDLDLFGQPNATGFRILRMEKLIGGATRTIVPTVTDGLLSATYLGSTVDVVGARFVLQHDNGKSYSLLVSAVHELQMWVTTSSGGTVSTPSYDLKWAEYGLPDRKHVFLCGPNPDAGNPTVPFVADFKAVLFERDWIDSESLRVRGERSGWFNVTCPGHALAKLHLTGFTRAGSNLTGRPTTFAQRTANLKLVTADYCGVGVPLTVGGQPLHWRSGAYNTTTATNEVEARFDDRGATCLTTPRVDFNPTPTNLAAFPDGVSELVKKLCLQAGKAVPPPCTGTVADLQNTHALSAHP